MDRELSKETEELLVNVAKLLDDLWPFTQETRREDKWRTTEQIANEQRGVKVLKGSQQAHIKTYGTPEQRGEGYKKMQKLYDEVAKRNSQISHSRLCAIVANKMVKDGYLEHCSEKTVYNHVKKPV